MSKKFGKLLVVSAVIGSAIGAVCYFARKKNAEHDIAEEDYDDFSEEEEKAGDSRSYVPLNSDGQACCQTEAAAEPEAADAHTDSAEESAQEEEPSGQEGFTPLADKVAEAAQKAEETVEEFFDEEDGSDEEPPISDN